MSSLVRRWSLVVLSSAVALSACGPARAELRGTIVEFGRTQADRGPPESKPDAGNGLSPARPMYGTRYVDHADVVEARLCRSFGVTVRIAGARVPDRVDVRVIHPRFTRPDGATSLEDDFPGDVFAGEAGVGFTFDNVWEMQPGRWRIVVSAGGLELASKTFEIVLGPPGSSRSDCPGALET